MRSSERRVLQRVPDRNCVAAVAMLSCAESAAEPDGVAVAVHEVECGCGSVGQALGKLSREPKMLAGCTYSCAKILLELREGVCACTH